jgi:DNA-binding transcriptional MerR regulator/methylmalonyl-CoA mutase cobalamin-binding subunit
MTGLSSDTIRAWERRYALVRPARNASGVRLYSERDVARLDLARSAVSLGHSIGQIAALSDPDLRSLLAEQSTKSPGTAIKSLAAQQTASDIVDAIARYDLLQAEALLNSAALLLTPTELIVVLLAPLMRAIGDRWEAKKLSIAQEHFASNLVRSLIGSLMRSRPPSGDYTMLFATPPGEAHEFGILFAACLAAVRGIRACVLGANVPANELLRAANKLRADGIVIGFVDNGNPTDVLDYLLQIRRETLQQTEIFIGGDAAFQLRAESIPARVERLASLSQFATRIGRLDDSG